MNAPTTTAGGSGPVSGRRRRWRLAATLLVLGLIAVLVPTLSKPVSATHVAPQFVAGNPTCGELGDSELELRVQPVADGTFTDGVLTVVIDVRDTNDGQVFDFTSNIPVESVFVKGGPDGNLYVYNPSVGSDTGLHAPVNPNNGKFYGLSHISFCYSPVPSTLVSVSASPTMINVSGESVTFTITEKNDGALPLTNVNVVTSSTACNSALSTATGDTNGNSKLDPGETWTWTCTIPVTGTAGDDFTLVVTGHGTDPLGRDVTFCVPGQPTTGKFCDEQEQDDVTVDIINPSTLVTVTAPATPIYAGESVTFTITEKNDGDVPLTNVSIDTSSDSCDAALTGPTGDAAVVNVLDPGETWTWTCTIPVAADLTLVVTGHGTDPTGDDVTFCLPGQPTTGKFCDPDERDDVAIDVIRSSTVVNVSTLEAEVESGDLVTFTITEHNDGDVSLSNVSVDTDSDACDAALSGPTGDTNTNGKLDPGETWSWTCTIPVSGAAGATFTLVATGHGTDPKGNDVTYCEPGQPTTGKRCDSEERDSTTVTIVEVGEGFTPGYWKNHPSSWPATGYGTGQTLESVFNVPDQYGLDNVTLVDALSLSGGKTTTGAAQTLMRAAVAALLNSAHPNVDYPRTTSEVIAAVNAALASNDRATILALASSLDADNNLGGDISD